MHTSDWKREHLTLSLDVATFSVLDGGLCVCVCAVRFMMIGLVCVSVSPSRSSPRSAVTSAASTHDAPIVLSASPNAPGDLTAPPPPRSPAECWWENSSAMYSYSTDEDEYSVYDASSSLYWYSTSSRWYAYRTTVGPPSSASSVVLPSVHPGPASSPARIVTITHTHTHTRVPPALPPSSSSSCCSSSLRVDLCRHPYNKT